MTTAITIQIIPPVIKSDLKLRFRCWQMSKQSQLRTSALIGETNHESNTVPLIIHYFCKTICLIQNKYNKFIGFLILSIPTKVN